MPPGQILDESERCMTLYHVLCEWERIPFGLTGTTHAFQTFVNDCLEGLSNHSCLAYLNEVLLYTLAKQNHHNL